MTDAKPDPHISWKLLIVHAKVIVRIVHVEKNGVQFSILCKNCQGLSCSNQTTVADDDDNSDCDEAICP